ncbi:glutamate--tRNA ligase [Ilumatobacter sp.]|uniref:glutamate--tRNA ligase n=1 Tax=Ilumatobacter sp. TaxID=1967498 RepID=UPI003B51E4C5
MSSDDRPGPRFRFAPSPTGIFHVGGARSALHNWALAHRHGGTFVLRIEDTDAARNEATWIDGIVDALAWIGISADDERFEGPFMQSAGAAAHGEAADRLFASGAAYYCDLSPEQVRERAEANGTTGYDGHSRDRGLGPGPGRVLRFRVPEGSTVVSDAVRGEVVFDNATIEDFVLVRGDGSPVFVLANVVDDIGSRITDVVRGEEHLPNTPKQQMLWEALGHSPPRWAHVPVLVNAERKKLSKRRDKVALEQYRDDGILADAMVNYLMTLGWTMPGSEEAGSEIYSFDEMLERFSLDHVTSSPAFFDIDKLLAFNGEHIRRLSADELVAACDPWLPADWDRDRFAAIAPHVQQRLTTLADAPGWVDFLFLDDPEIDDQAWSKTMSTEYARGVLADSISAYEAAEWRHEVLKETMEREVMAAHGLKLGKAQAPVRVAVTGRTVGPPLFEALEVMGRDEALRRMRAALLLLDDRDDRTGRADEVGGGSGD